MKSFNTYVFLAFIAAFVFTACESDVSIDDFDSGEANFSNYVALGNSLTAGYADGALYLSAQENSYPALMAEQFAMVGGGSFTQPLVNDDTGGLVFGSNPVAEPKFVLGLTGGSLGPVRTTETPTTDFGASIASAGPYNNLGVPGAKSFHLLGPDYGSVPGVFAGTANPYYARFSQPGTSVVDDAVAQSPTFYSVWIGNNDVLGYATTGGAGDVITPVADFANYIGAILQNMSATGANGIIANIPSVTDVPYFNTVPAQSIPLTDQGLVDQINNGYAQYNGGLSQLVALGALSAEEADMRTINFSMGVNYPVTADSDLTDLSAYGLPSLRQLTDDDLVTLTAASVIGSQTPNGVVGVQVPLGDEYVLSAVELDEVSTAINGYNTTINSLAANFGIPVADMNGFFADVANDGITWNGADLSVEFVTGGLFSLDGIHPTQKGYALIANKFIEQINDTYDANVPTVDINNYPGVEFP